MLCPRCYGKHVVNFNGARIPCPECAGVGEIHCCDGLREQDCLAEESTKYQMRNPKSRQDEPASRA